MGPVHDIALPVDFFFEGLPITVPTPPTPHHSTLIKHRKLDKKPSHPIQSITFLSLLTSTSSRKFPPAYPQSLSTFFTINSINAA
ncbi:hypothetical protein CGGC5_v006210 [Colletotrichum fructicola Nara gc5]|uniref:Uncharacterized protein n=1 Tax=Colletotrichum fructicola (strain Nara gc5) TaxID=1213859 RepID=A0A7J6JCH2_COLFN|nr:hypothetical protein CGGC5_v006210 [Colletotrichum fructicola Nara gc5]